MDYETCVKLMNEQLVGQYGVIMLGDNEDYPKSLGKFTGSEMVSCNVLFHFSEGDIFLFTPLRIFNTGVMKENGSFACQTFSTKLFIGDRFFGEIVNQWIEEEKKGL